ncbi:YIP1 family protein [Candidatus Woesearchaeota archaeon]|nr:YIP1 family protein [Candidatus Woesearchaeota archaeon]
MAKKDFLTEMFLEWKNILIKPTQTLSQFPERKLSKSTLYILIAGFISGSLYKITATLMGQKAVGVIIFGPIIVLMVMYFVGFFLWIIGKLFGTKTNLSKWLSSFFSAYAPLGALSGIIFINFFVGLYGIFILFLSIKNFMKLSKNASFLITAIYLLCIVLVSIWYYFYRLANALPVTFYTF